MFRPFTYGGQEPRLFPSPFAQQPHPLARSAAVDLQARLTDFGEGKMFGVLVVRLDTGAVGYIAGYSGMVEGKWQRQGFVPPVFDVAAQQSMWRQHGHEIDSLSRQLDVAAKEARLDVLHEQINRQRLQHAEARAEMKQQHAVNRAERKLQRVGADRETLRKLSYASADDKRVYKDLLAQQRKEAAAFAEKLAGAAAPIEQLESRRQALSQALLPRMQDNYQLLSASGAVAPLRSLFPGGSCPGGAADCAAPKLLQYAYRHGMQPLALAEFWWGDSPPSSARHHGHFYPACAGKCGPVLGHMLTGLDVEPAPLYGATPPPGLSVIFEDDCMLAIDKPSGLLSVPGRHRRLRDSVKTRLDESCGAAFTPYLVHRLDLDTSGVLLIAKDKATHKALQKQFALRQLEKTYEAMVRGEAAARGRIDLPLTVDVHDRPRHIVSMLGGKAAITDYQRLSLYDGRARMRLLPRTGRTHQLRVHCSHPRGLDAPIAGDRLYGDGAEERLLLHATRLRFAHPHSAAAVEILSPVPF